MSKAFPTPWTFEAEDACEDSPIKAANGEYVLVRDNGVYPPDLETCREIVDAMNERDRMRDIVWRLLNAVDAMHTLIARLNPDMMPVAIHPGSACLEVDVGDVVRDARDALKASERHSEK